MLVRMTLKEEENLKLLNDKNQAFTRVAKYYKEEDHIIVLLFTSYKFKVPVQEVFARYQRLFTTLSPRLRLTALMNFFNDYNSAYKGNFVFVPLESGQNIMSRFIPQ